MGIAIVIIVVAGRSSVIGVVLVDRRAGARPPVALSRETRKRDASASTAARPQRADGDRVGRGRDGEARERADETRTAIESAQPSAAPRAAAASAVEYEPVDDEELGVTRRQFFNRGDPRRDRPRPRRVRRRGARVPLAVGPAAASAARSTSARVADIQDRASTQQEPVLRRRRRRTYIVAVPEGRPPEGQEGAAYTPPILAGHGAGLSSRCTRSACTSAAACRGARRSQWFECPCHGSKYNRVGEKKGGPAPRGLDRFAARGARAATSSSTPATSWSSARPIGTNTTGQSPRARPVSERVPAR